MWFMRFLAGLSGFYLACTQRHSAAEPQPKGRRNGDAANDQKPNAKYQNRIGKAPAKMWYDGAMHLSALRVDICSGHYHSNSLFLFCQGRRGGPHPTGVRRPAACQDARAQHGCAHCSCGDEWRSVTAYATELNSTTCPSSK